MSTKPWREIKSKSDTEREAQMDKSPDEDDGGKDRPTTGQVAVRYWDGVTDVFERVADIGDGPNGNAFVLTGPGPDIIIPQRNVRFLAVNGDL